MAICIDRFEGSRVFMKKNKFKKKLTQKLSFAKMFEIVKIKAKKLDIKKSLTNLSIALLAHRENAHQR